jgi:hypothetical protein
MATLSGHRTAARAAAATAALLSAALTLGASPVHAASGTTVEFSGGSVLSVLVCKSHPSTTQVTIAAETRITFVNHLGQAASLEIDGKAVSAVGVNQAVPVIFHRGPVNVSMTFDCGVGVVEEFKSVAVIVMAPVATNQGGVGGAAGSVSGAAGRTATATRPGSSTTSGARSAGGAATTSGAGEAAGQRDASRTGATGAEPVDPAAAGATAANGAAVPAVPGGAGDAETPPVLVEAPVPASGASHGGPAGLLALVATVCVVGVGMAAIRAIMARRTSRAGLA